MLKQLLYKLFGLEDPPCASCELLRAQLEACNSERKELLIRLLDKDKEVPVLTQKEDLQPIQPHFIPWRVRQQMLEEKDREAAKVLREKEAEIRSTQTTEQTVEELEKELGVKDA